MYTQEEINKAKEEIKKLPGNYISQNLQLEIDEGDNRVKEIVQISPVTGMLPNVFVVIIFKKGVSYY